MRRKGGLGGDGGDGDGNEVGKGVEQLVGVAGRLEELLGRMQVAGQEKRAEKKNNKNEKQGKQKRKVEL